jgi:hypothetical protein
MKFTEYEKNILLVSLDHMKEHLEAIEHEGVITEDTYNLRTKAVKTAATKIKEMSKIKWNEETLQHFRFQSKYTGAKEVLDAVTSFVECDCVPEDGETEEYLIADLMEQIYK